MRFALLHLGLMGIELHALLGGQHRANFRLLLLHQS